MRVIRHTFAFHIEPISTYVYKYILQIVPLNLTLGFNQHSSRFFFLFFLVSGYSHFFLRRRRKFSFNKQFTLCLSCFLSSFPDFLFLSDLLQHEFLQRHQTTKKGEKEFLYPSFFPSNLTGPLSQLIMAMGL